MRILSHMINRAIRIVRRAYPQLRGNLLSLGAPSLADFPSKRWLPPKYPLTPESEGMRAPASTEAYVRVCPGSWLPLCVCARARGPSASALLAKYKRRAGRVLTGRGSFTSRAPRIGVAGLVETGQEHRLQVDQRPPLPPIIRRT